MGKVINELKQKVRRITMPQLPGQGCRAGCPQCCRGSGYHAAGQRPVRQAACIR